MFLRCDICGFLCERGVSMRRATDVATFRHTNKSRRTLAIYAAERICATHFYTACVDIDRRTMPCSRFSKSIYVCILKLHLYLYVHLQLKRKRNLKNDHKIYIGTYSLTLYHNDAGLLIDQYRNSILFFACRIYEDLNVKNK